MIRFIGYTGLEVVIFHAGEVVRHRSLNRSSVNHHSVAVVCRNQQCGCEVGEQGCNVLGVPSTNQQVHGLVAVGDDGDEAP